MSYQQARRYLSIFLLIGIPIPLLTSSTFAQDWQGLRPLQATCLEVERALGGKACGEQSATYTLQDETVTFQFSKAGCDEHRFGKRYNVPDGTVVSISVLPKASKHLTITDLKIELSKFQKTEVSDMVGVFKYVSPEIGMYLTASGDGQVLDVVYVPAASFDNLLCQPSTEPNPLDKLKALEAPTIKIGSYDPESPEKESELIHDLIRRLAEFANQTAGAKKSKAIVYVIAYTKQRSEVGVAKKIAERVRDRLVNIYNINNAEIIILDGGYRQGTVVELYIQSHE